MSVSALRELEACPRRWALTWAWAGYPDLWDERGYPPKIHMAALSGTVVHLATEEITKSLVLAGCSSPQSAEAVAVVKQLGGYSVILTNCVDAVIASHRTNPRAAPLLEAASRKLKNLIPDMRAHVQALLGRVRLRHVSGAPSRSEPSPFPRERRPLGPGVYPELEVRAPSIGWRGRIDVLNLSETACEIVDFKTGVQQDDHASQVRMYAVIWNCDSELNPTARPADRLTLSYRSGEKTVEPVGQADFEPLRRELADRATRAREVAAVVPPEARPTADNCRYCGVRQLCEEYWKPDTQRAIGATLTDASPFIDVELVVRGRHGPASWDCSVTTSRLGRAGEAILLRTRSSDPDLRRDSRVRVLDAHTSPPTQDGEPSIVTLGASSEMFVVERT
jgi:hypothetical protein